MTIKKDKEKPLKNKNKTSKKQIITFVALVVGALIMFFPFYWTFIASVKTKTEFWQYPPTLFPETVMWSNYSEALEGNVLLYVFNSIFTAGTIVVWHVVSSAMMAYALVRYDFRLKKTLFALLMVLQMLPAAATYIPLYVMLSDISLLDTYAGIIVSNCASIVGVFLLRQYFLQVDKGLLEAAQIDGASDMHILWRIMVPVSKPAIIMIMLKGFVDNYMWPSLITKSPEKYLVSQGLRMFFVQESAYGIKFPQMMAANIIVIIPMLVLFAFTQKWFESGISDTGSKG